MLGHSKYLNNCHSINSQPKNSFYSQIMVIMSYSQIIGHR